MRLDALTEHVGGQTWNRPLGRIRKLVLGFEWQVGALSVPIARGDVLVAWGNPRCLSNVVLLLVARWKGVRVVWWGHYWSSTSSRWSAAIRIALMRLADYLLFYTDMEVAEYLGRQGRKAPDRIFALNNGIDTAEIAKLRTTYRARVRGRRLLFVGRLTEKANVALLLNALAGGRCHDVELHVIGGGELEPSLRALAAELQLGNRVRWHGATTDERMIAKVANECTLFVYPGSVGLSLIHGLAYGLPAVVHGDRWAHMPEIAAMNPGENGFTFRKGDVQSLTDVIADALSDEPRLEVMSLEALDTTTRSYNAESMEKRFCEAIAKISDEDATRCRPVPLDGFEP